MKGTAEGQLRIDIRREFEQLKESLFSDIIYVVKIASANKSIYTEESFWPHNRLLAQAIFLHSNSITETV